MKNDNEKWDKRFMNLASTIALWSKDPVIKVGAVIVRHDKSIASTGYNGFPTSYDDTEFFYKNKAYKKLHMLHAEENALRFMMDHNTDGFSLYTTFHPCKKCADKIIASGIKRVITMNLDRAFHGKDPKFIEKWTLRFIEVNEYLDANDVTVKFIG